MKQFLIDLKEVFCSALGLLSSKRIFGGVGLLSCIAMSWYCVITNSPAPSMADPILYVSCTLLGVDSVISGIKNGKTK